MNTIGTIAASLLLLTQVGCGSPEAKRAAETSEQAKEDSSPISAPMADQRAESANLGESSPSSAYRVAQRAAASLTSEQPEQSTVLLAGHDPSAPPPPKAPLAPPRAPAAARLLIYHADVRLKTTAMPRATARLDSLVRSSNGYLSAATEAHTDGEWQQETTIRVPPAQFQMLLSGLAGLGTVEKKELSTADVTAVHADVAARLQAKRAIEKQYTALLSKAQKIKDILDVEERLGAVREEIEATESRLKTLNSEVAYSTITLTLHQPISRAVPDAPVVSLGSRVVEAFYGGWRLLTSLLVWAITLWPLLILGVGGWWLWQRRRAQPAAPALPADREAA